MIRKLVPLLAVLAIAALGIAACGGDDDDDSGSASAEQATPEEEAAGEATSSTVPLEADPGGILAYDTEALAAKAENGKVTIDFSNPALTLHDVRIEDASGKDVGGTDTIMESDESVTLDLEPGEYVFFCSVGGHREAGMVGSLTVE